MSGDMSSPFSVSNSIASVSGDLPPQDAAWFRKIMSDCILCPRACHADRLDDGVGYCGQTAEPLCIIGRSPVSPVLPVPVPSFSPDATCAVSSARTITSLWGKPDESSLPNIW